MTNADIKARVERARELDKLATPGPWGFYHPIEFPKDWRISTGPNEPPYWIGRLTKAQASGLGSEPPREEDARFIAESRTLLPAFAADVERLQGENTKLTQELGAELLKQAKAVVADFHRENVLVQRAEERADKAQSATEALRADVTDWAHRHNEEAILRAQLAAKSMLLEADRDREKERADRAEQAYADRMKTLAGFQLELDSKKEREESLRRQLEAAHRTIADDAALLAIAKDFARNAAPILRLHNKLVEAAKAGDDRAVNRIVAELGLIESPL